MQRRVLSWRRFAVGVALVGVLTAAAAIVAVRHSRTGTDDRWAQAVPRMLADLRAGLDAANAGNAQGRLDAHTRMAAECRKAGQYRAGDSGAERRVRAACASQNLPIGE